MREETAAAQSELAERQQQRQKHEGGPAVAAAGGDGKIRYDDFKGYVLQVKQKLGGYKEKKALLGALQSEVGLLSRTKQILEKQLETLQRDVQVRPLLGLSSRTSPLVF